MEGLHSDDPRRIGSYRLLARLGVGGMGRVYLGRSGGGRTVAVKVVHPELGRDPEFRRRFAGEVSAAREVGGEWTAPVLDADTESDRLWVATGYIAGPTLQETAPLPERSLPVLVDGLARALRTIHGCGLIHRDLKPSNVLLTLDGPKVIDFGIARAVDSSMGTRTGVVIGTPGFLSPEQIRGEKITQASDVFSLGAVLVFAATGRQPFETKETSLPAILLKTAEGEPELGAMSGPMLELAVACLAKDPRDRPGVEHILAVAEFAAPPADGSWLPGDLVTQVGRHAIELLELESPPTGPQPAAEPQPSPEPQADGSVPGTPAERADARTEIFPMIDEPDPPPRRRIFIPVLLSLAALAVIAGGLWLGLTSMERPESGTTPVVPDLYVGTWTGRVQTDAGGNLRTKEITIPAGPIESAEVTTTTTYFDDRVCAGGGRVVAADRTSATIATESDQPGCGRASQTLTPQPDGTLTWRAGKSSGTLRRK